MNAAVPAATRHLLVTPQGPPGGESAEGVPKAIQHMVLSPQATEHVTKCTPRAPVDPSSEAYVEDGVIHPIPSPSPLRPQSPATAASSIREPPLPPPHPSSRSHDLVPMVPYPDPKRVRGEANVMKEGEEGERKGKEQKGGV
uniref:Uncharacterized protein n=1 Tax=Chromera velia CCMP2878 TaxID=1169474 RepID=A0A0G4HRV3_9ALVE|eukprot:Cvel_30787.t1-p1 / transcript=Cvel_30787.t1 / gene=Cvel_30787 / organism=Chromera_velia_CCMP2878 / gene_product=hypothetical protein / transcript_product=hypothetical protein / location=Cvel_scaffold4453:9255-9677(-) / protein_length=141 / sequence_SO=supercontig / SO=protein_coding / is_pseudo=false